METALLNFWATYKTQLVFAGDTILKVLVFLNGIMGFTALLTLGERKISALMQDRIGPNRASIFGFSLGGLFHPVADGIKLLTKEDFVPAKADRFFFTLAPIVGLLSVLTCFAFIPFGDHINIFGYRMRLLIADIDSSLFLILAVSSLAIYAPFMGGYFSGNNFAVLGAMRAAAQMISYEAVLGLSLIPMVMIYSSGSLSEIAVKQGELIFGFLPAWGIFIQPLAFLLFLAAAVAENKRTPFDVVEGESEIVGYFIEYSSMRFGAFMFAEFIEIIFVSMMAVTFFLGSWQLPYLGPEGFSIPFSGLIKIPDIAISIIQMAAFAGKTAVFSVFLLIVRWTLPRMRFDQIMSFCWKFMLPLALINIVITAMILRSM
ncbi:MAG: NADH-quinone oxidoreductase subunit NuoH [Elusimicrobiota bacterium]